MQTGASLGPRLPGAESQHGDLVPAKQEDRLTLLDCRLQGSAGVGSAAAFWTKLNTLASNCLLFDYRWDMIY